MIEVFGMIGMLFVIGLTAASFLYWSFKNPAFALMAGLTIIFFFIFINYGASWGWYNEQEAIQNLEKNQGLIIFLTICFAVVLFIKDLFLPILSHPQPKKEEKE